jgi:hypothetical protein
LSSDFGINKCQNSFYIGNKGVVVVGIVVVGLVRFELEHL